MRRRGPSALSEVLREALAGAAPQTPLARVQAAWPGVAGAAVAAEASPASEREGVVVVECSSAVWAQELELLGADLRERLNRTLGAPLVQRLRFRVTAP
jgi:predicted nucleic acid-binding Zn ribbon protein